MILLDTDTFSLHQSAHERVTKRIAAAIEVPAITLITQIEALRGRYDAVMKAENGTHVLRNLQGLERTINHLALFEVVPFNEAAAVQFDRLIETKGLKRIGPGRSVDGQYCPGKQGNTGDPQSERLPKSAWLANRETGWIEVEVSFVSD